MEYAVYGLSAIGVIAIGFLGKMLYDLIKHPPIP